MRSLRTSVVAMVALLSFLSAQPGPPNTLPTPPALPPRLPPVPSVGWTNSSTTIDPRIRRSTAHPARLANLSIRATAGAGSGALIAGAFVEGRGTLPTLVRAIGPGLRPFGVAAPLRDPNVEIFRETIRAASATGLTPATAAASAYVGAFPLAADTASAPGDAAVFGESAVGTLTAHCRSATDATGIALLELYDATVAPTTDSARFTRFSARAQIGSGEGLAIIGFTIVGDGELRLLIQGVGQSLSVLQNLPGVLADPALELYAGNTLIAANDNWGGDGADSAAALRRESSIVGAFPVVAPSDAAMLVTLRAGSYSLHLRGASGQSGIALAEIYEAPPVTAAFDTARAINAVGLDLYRQLAANATDRNFALSPYAIQSALALAYTGAAGDTRTEMANALRFPAENTLLQAGFAALRTALVDAAAKSIPLARAQTDSGLRTDPIEWNAANRLFGQPGFPFRAPFLSLLRDGFAAPMEFADFDADPEIARLRINDWVAAQTKQKILDLIGPSRIDRLTRLVLVNALHLKAPWASPFRETATTPQVFRPTPTTSRLVPTMSATTNHGFAAEDGFTVVNLSYLTGELHYLVILPDEGQSLASAAARLTPEHFSRWSRLGTDSSRSVDLHLPKSKIAGSAIELNNALDAMGMRTPFQKLQANFDGIVPLELIFPENLYISKVLHKAFVEIDEAGTEAAAATTVINAVPISISFPPPPITVRVDRPYLFAIQHRASGACLFLGHVSDPR